MEPIRELIAVDLEMTGLQVKTDRILEIGAVRLVDGQLRDTFQTFVNPHRRIDARITELTGIWPEMVENAPEAEEALRKFLELDRKSTRLNSSHITRSRMPSSA